MAVNPNVNKLIYAGQVLIDLTSDTVNAEHLAKNYTAHDKSGASIVGTMETGGFEVLTTTVSKSSGTSAKFTITNLSGQPKIFIMYKNVNTSTNGYIAYAILQSDGTYIGKTVTGDTSMSTRYKNSNATWTASTNTFEITLWNSYGTYDIYYVI